jgi:hypothetical protein
MIKKFLILSFLLFGFIQANIIEDKVRNILGEDGFNQHQKLIKILFVKTDDFMSGGMLKYIDILNLLKENGLLQLKYSKPKELEIEFVLSSSPVKTLRILNDTLRSLGYYYYFTKKAIYLSDGSFVWNIKMQAEYAIDPLIFIKELKLKEIFVKNITRDDLRHWKYEFDTKNGKISKALKIEANEKVSLGKPLDNYLLSIKDVDTLKIISKKLNRWYPYIVFYNKDLKVLKTIERKRVYKGIQTTIPKDTKYIKIGDIYNLINIKRGLSVIVQSTQGEK